MADERINDPEWLERMYWKEGLSLEDISDIVGHPVSTIGYKMKIFDEVKRPSEGSESDKFWRLVDNKNPGECWLWEHSIDKNGYGRFRSKYLAHRKAYELEFEPPGDKNVNHYCDVKNCVNPSHLYLGTQQDNMNDAKIRGQIKKGENHPHAKITESDAKDIKRRGENGEAHESIASDFDISRPAVTNIINGRKWRHI